MHITVKLLFPIPVVIMVVCGIRTNTCDRSNIDKFVIARARFGLYKKCTDQSLKEIMVQMDIDRFVNIRAMSELLMKVSPAGNYIDRHMINNVKIRGKKKKFELNLLNIKIEPRNFDTTFGTAYKKTRLIIIPKLNSS